VARDAASGELGVAVQSHWFSVGRIVSWATPGVGAVATQANVAISYGPRALELLADGLGPEAALARLRAEDPAGATRQVAVLDADGNCAVHTGEECIPYAGHAVGDGVCCQANMMAGPGVWPAMLEAYRTAEGPLAWRLLAALDAAEAAGGDVRGGQSAAMLVVPASGEPWETLVSLRVEDHEAPLAELRRLLELHEAYELADRADELTGLGEHDEAAGLFRRAHELAPGNHELLFWAGVGAAQRGDWESALTDVRSAIALRPAWRELLSRLPASVAPAAPELLRRLSE
jgi:uncharacterized Ntn-hydrolase superfamily protein